MSEARTRGRDTGRGGARNAAQPRPVPPGPDGIEDESEDATEAHGGSGRVLFTIRGRDYMAPNKLGANVALAYMRDVRERGTECAVAGVMIKVVGKDQFDELCDDDDLDSDELNIIMDTVVEFAMGKMEKGGKGPAARRR